MNCELSKTSFFFFFFTKHGQLEIKDISFCRRDDYIRRLVSSLSRTYLYLDVAAWKHISKFFAKLMEAFFPSYQHCKMFSITDSHLIKINLRFLFAKAFYMAVCMFTGWWTQEHVTGWRWDDYICATQLNINFIYIYRYMENILLRIWCR